jgi:hypothetical protein
MAMAETIADELLRAAPRSHTAHMHWG